MYKVLLNEPNVSYRNKLFLFLVASNVLLSPGRQNILSYATGTTSGHIVDIVRASLLSTEGGEADMGLTDFISVTVIKT